MDHKAPAYLGSIDSDSSCSGLCFQGCLCREQSWKIKTVSSSAAIDESVYCAV